MNPIVHRFQVSLPLLTLVALACGCQRHETFTLAGVVKVGEEIPDQGSIVIEPVHGGKVLGASLDRGAFQIADVPAGEAKVRFTLTKKSGTTQLATDGPTVDRYVDLVPERYRDGMTFNVTSDQLDLVFDLESRKP